MTKFRSLAKRRCDSGDVRRAKSLRKDAPLVERLLWEALREAAKIQRLHFRRQHQLPPYIVDFACVKARLVIEIDGPSHDVRAEQDERRDVYLNSLGYVVMRFSNEDVRKNLEGVVLTILNCARARIEELYTPRP
jgi:very-short-patch-repair endonuclease